ncbi:MULTISPECIES: creatininase family protein [Fictibacillus]|uniref:Creatininase family protein n=1 Tax=Fictibacillus terranigra TaxID=3058424 RepID=A0ABT8E8D8_9BACL|nr:creatininase family protein [Fictibacillus sp. CENA-BCM004]MDN4074148.1 creatininase family protein [Fictibacillus sp. CENA-BCM004]
MKSVWLQENKWEDVQNYLKEKQTIIVPFGSVEQHARHLPMGTDSFVAIKVAEDAAKQTDTLIAPPNWVGWAPHHMAYPGTITLRPETLTNLMLDVCESLTYHGFQKIIVINGHREANLPPLKIAATKLRNKTGAFICIVDPFYFAESIGKKIRKSEPGGVGHADEMETSHMMHLFPELCNMEAAVKNIHEKHSFLNHDPFIDGDRIFLPSDVATYRESSNHIGVVGDPSVSTAENGEIYHKELIANMVELIDYCNTKVEVTLRNQKVPL